MAHMKRTQTTSKKPATTKLGPGEYTPDIAIHRIEDLPRPKVIKQNRNYDHHLCPKCHKSSYRDRVYTRTLHDVGDLVSGHPHEIHLTYSQHFCSVCRKYFPADLSDLAPPSSHYTYRVISLATRVVVEDGLPYRTTSWALWRDHRVFVPFATIQNWVEAAGKKNKLTSRNRLSGLGTRRLLRLPHRR